MHRLPRGLPSIDRVGNRLGRIAGEPSALGLGSKESGLTYMAFGSSTLPTPTRCGGGNLHTLK